MPPNEFQVSGQNQKSFDLQLEILKFEIYE